MRSFLAGLLLLSSIILVAACSNLGTLFAARTTDRSRQLALRLALGSTRARILRGLFTEALLIALVGGVIGFGASTVALRLLSLWHPFPNLPTHLIVSPDARVYGLALLLTVSSGFLFGAVPMRQVLKSEPHEIITSGGVGIIGRRITARDLLHVLQIPVCALLVTSSLWPYAG